MKYLKYIILGIIFLPLNVLALEEITIKCPEVINKNEDFSCEVIGNAPYLVSALEYEFSLPDYIDKKDFKVDSSWEGDEESNLVLLYTDENKESPFKIGTITLNSSKNIDIVDIETKYLLLGDEEYQEHLIIEKKDVKEVESTNKLDDNKKNNYLIYGIIILIIVVIIAIAFIIRRRVKI